MALTKAQLVDMNGLELILDLDADTSIHASTDDQIDIKIGGADDFRFTVNTFTGLAGSTITSPTIVGSTSVQTPLIEFTDGDDAMTIADGGVVTFAQAPVLSGASLTAGTTPLTTLDIDGATDIGAAIVDADLLIIDDGAGGTNRKVAASRLKTFIGSDTGGFAITNLDIDGGTDIGADLVDADLFIIDDGAGGTNRKVAMSRVKTYIGSSTAADDLTIGDAAITLQTSSGNITIDATANDTDIIFKGTDNNADITMLTLDGSAAGDATFNNQVIVGDGKLVLGSTAVTSTAAELNLLDNVSGLVQADLTKLAAVDATAAELNLLDGVSGLVQADLTKLAAIDSTAAELNILDDATVTTAELNLIDGGTARGTTAVATGDGILINDGGTMRMTNVDTVSTYFAGHNVGGGNIVTTGALDSGSITSGFGAIDNGTSNIRSATITAETAFVPDAANGATLGTASLEFADMYLHDGGIVYFGADQDVKLAHVADVGLTLKTATTSDDTKATLTLQTGDTDIAANDVLGQLHFQAPDEGAGTDAILVAAGIAAISEGDFSASNNATKLSFQTGASEAASEKMSLSSAGLLTIADDLIIGNGKTIGSVSDPDSMTIASGGAVTFSQVPVFPNNTVETADIQDNAITLAKLAGGTDGNIISFDASGDPVAIATGSDGQVLTSTGAGSAPAFEDAAGGAYNLLSTTTVSSGTAAVNITSDINSTFKDYFIKLTDIHPSEDNEKLRFQVFSSSGSPDTGSNYLYGGDGINSADSTSSHNSGGTTFGEINTIGIGNTNIESSNALMYLFNPSGTTFTKMIMVDEITLMANGNVEVSKTGIAYTQTVAITGIRFFMSSGNLDGGVIKLYGIT